MEALCFLDVSVFFESESSDFCEPFALPEVSEESDEFLESSDWPNGTASRFISGHGLFELEDEEPEPPSLTSARTAKLAATATTRNAMMMATTFVFSLPNNLALATSVPFDEPFFGVKLGGTAPFPAS